MPNDLPYSSIKCFMPHGAREPNEHYRPWIETHIGKQGVDWDWGIHSVVNNTLIVHFRNGKDATLFELTWP